MANIFLAGCEQVAYASNSTRPASTLRKLPRGNNDNMD